MTTRPLLELHLHLNNGNTHKLVQNDPQLAEQLLEQINLNIFSQPSLVFFGQNKVVTYAASVLTGISILMEPMPESVLRLMDHPTVGVEESREISHEEYKRKQQEVQPLVEGQPFVMLHEIEFMSSQRLWVELHVKAAAPAMRERHIVKTPFEGMGLVCRRLGGGISIWNRAQMISYSFCPQPEVPLPALPALPAEIAAT